MFRQLKMSHKLWLAVSAIVVLLVAVVGFSGTGPLVDTGAERGRDPGGEPAARCRGAMDRPDGHERHPYPGTGAQHEPAVQAEFMDAIAATSAKISEVQKSLEAMPLSDREKRRWTRSLQPARTWLRA